MSRLQKLDVRLCLGPGEERRVGTLAEGTAGQHFFEYDADFLLDPWWLSPFKLPPRAGLFQHKDREFGPLPGLFADSLPDGWGLLLMSRYFAAKGRTFASVTPLERLAFLGRNTMGALTFHPPAEAPGQAGEKVDLDELASSSREVLRGDARELLPMLLRTGGSPGGARPKVLVGLRGEELIAGEGDLPPDFEAWMVKFAVAEDATESGRIEAAYARMAEAAGIDMPPTRLFETAGGAAFFGVKRFDREGTKRVHIHTFGGLIHADFRIPSCDYQQLLEVSALLTKSQLAAEQQYRRMVFNVMAHNRDDHVKNFSFLLRGPKDWQLTPAYDLTFAEGPGGEHSMTVAGEGKAPGKKELLSLAGAAGLTAERAKEICEEVQEAVAAWPRFAEEQGLVRARTKQIGSRLETLVREGRL